MMPGPCKSPPTGTKPALTQVEKVTVQPEAPVGVLDQADREGAAVQGMSGSVQLHNRSVSQRAAAGKWG